MQLCEEDIFRYLIRIFKSLFKSLIKSQCILLNKYHYIHLFKSIVGNIFVIL